MAARTPATERKKEHPGKKFVGGPVFLFSRETRRRRLMRLSDTFGAAAAAAPRTLQGFLLRAIFLETSTRGSGVLDRRSESHRCVNFYIFFLFSFFLFFHSSSTTRRASSR